MVYKHFYTQLHTILKYIKNMLEIRKLREFIFTDYKKNQREGCQISLSH